MQLFKIGEIAKACNLSVKTLRYYEELGLIVPKKVDIYSGYRYYDNKNVETVYKIQALKDLGFSLLEIKDFNNQSLNIKIKEIKSDMKKLKKKLTKISYLKIQKGEKIMKPFINDEKVIGKWKYLCSTENVEKFNQGETYFDEEAFQELYFLPNGEGYWVFDGWTKGIIYYFKGNHYNYSIINEKLFVETFDENQEYEHTLVYEKVDNKEYVKDDIATKDDVNIPFTFDQKAAGSWLAVDFIPIKEKFNYKPKFSDDLFLKSLSLLPNGDCFKEFKNGNIDKIRWTKDNIIGEHLVSNFIVQNIEGEDYLIIDWKSGDYVFGGKIYGCYVFKKQK